ncbi:MAG: efflux RND transporter periplasmic adaptor subunit [Verrucomicrobia bacterium]|nr:efflux RND transporter periplasmic adaptor subunit [Verrucomicrobiota bacterium]
MPETTSQLEAEPTGREARPKRKKRHLWLIFLVACACFVALAAVGINRRSANTNNLKQVAQKNAQITVVTVHPERAPASINVDLPGQTQAYFQAPLFAQTSGYLKKWYSDIGARVKAGDVLGEIETPEVDQQWNQAKAQVKVAEAASALAEATYKRDQDLFNRKVISAQEFDSASDTFHENQSTVSADQANLDRLTALEQFKLIKAPFDGIVTARNTDLGALVNSGSGNALFTISQVSPLRVYVSVPERLAGYVKLGMKADLTFETFPGRKFTAEVVHTAGAIDISTRTLLTELEIPNKTEELFPGAYAQVHFQTQGSSAALLVPANTLLFRSEGAAVGVVGPEGKVQIRKIKIGRDLGTQLEIVEGLSISDNVIVNPSDGLENGMEVQVQSQAGQQHPVAKNP